MALDAIARAMAAQADSKAVTAYQYAVAGGYTGTEQEFQEEVALMAENAQAVNNAVRFDLAQEKTDEEKLQAQSNLGLNTSEGSLQEQLDNKAGIDDYCAGLTAGQAENFVPSEPVIDTDPYNYRTTAGNEEVNGLRLKDIVGGTLALNQILKLKTASAYPQSGITATQDENGVITLSGTASTTYAAIFDNYTPIVGHKYIFASKIIANPNNVSGIRFGFLNNNYDGAATLGTGTIVAVSGTVSGGAFGIRDLTAETDLTGIKFIANVIDITVDFGTIPQTVGTTNYASIADYVYALGQSNGIEWLYKYFPILNGGSIPFSAPTLASVCADRRVAYNVNLFNKATAVANSRWKATGVEEVNGTSRSTLIRCLPQTAYGFKNVHGAQSMSAVYWFDINGNYISANSIEGNSPQSGEFTSPNNAYYVGINFLSSELDNVMLGLYYGTPLTYVAYDPTTYSLGHDTLRGIYMLDSFGNLYLDRTKNDTKTPDGEITRRFGFEDMGDLEWERFAAGGEGVFRTNLASKALNRNLWQTKYTLNTVATSVNDINDKEMWCSLSSTYIYIKDTAYSDVTTLATALNGYDIQYELATPTTESGTEYTELEKADNLSTEEIVDYEYEQGNRPYPLPVGTYSEYAPDYRSKVEEMPAAPLEDGDYIVRVANGKTSYVKLGSAFPDTPTEDGSYLLGLTKSGTTVTMAWVAQA